MCTSPRSWRMCFDFDSTAPAAVGAGSLVVSVMLLHVLFVVLVVMMDLSFEIFSCVVMT
jgi:hypothetical protein